MTPDELMDDEAARNAEAAAARLNERRSMASGLISPSSDESPFTSAGSTIPNDNAIAVAAPSDVAAQQRRQKAQREAFNAGLQSFSKSPAGQAMEAGGEYLQKAGGNLLGLAGAGFDAVRSIPPYALTKLERFAGGEASPGTFTDEKRLLGQVAAPVWESASQAADLWNEATSKNAPPRAPDVRIPHEDTNSGEQLRRAGENFGVAFDSSAPWQDRVVSGLAGTVRGAAVMGNPFGGMKEIAGEMLPGLNRTMGLARSFGGPTVGEAAGAVGKSLADAFPASRGINFPSGGAPVRRGVFNLLPGEESPANNAMKRVLDMAHKVIDPKGWAKKDLMKLSDESRDAVFALADPVIQETGGVEKYAAMDDFHLEQALRNSLREGEQAERPWRTMRSLDAPTGAAEEGGSIGTMISEPKSLEGLGPKTDQVRAERGLTPEQRQANADLVVEAINAADSPAGVQGVIDKFNKTLKTQQQDRILRDLGMSPARDKAKNTAQLQEYLSRNFETPPPPTTPEGLQAANEMEVARQAEEAAGKTNVSPQSQQNDLLPAGGETVAKQNVSPPPQKDVRVLEPEEPPMMTDEGPASLPPPRSAGAEGVSPTEGVPHGQVENRYGETAQDPWEDQRSYQAPRQNGVEPPRNQRAGVEADQGQRAEVLKESPKPPPHLDEGADREIDQIQKQLGTGGNTPPPPKPQPPNPNPNRPSPPQPTATQQSPPDKVTGLFKPQIDRVKDWSRSPAMQAMAEGARRVMGRVTDAAAQTIPKIQQAVMNIVDRRYAWMRKLSPDPARRELVEYIPSSNSPKMLYTKLNASVDDHARLATGQPAPWREQRAADFEDAVRLAVEDSGLRAESAGTMRMDANGNPVPFTAAPAGGRVPIKPVNQPWLVEGNPDGEDFLTLLLQEPGNQNMKREDFWKGMEALRVDPESEAGYEFSRSIKAMPDAYVTRDGRTWQVNRGATDLIPNPYSHTDLVNWYKKEVQRAEFIREYGQRGFDPKHGVRDLIEGPNGLRAQAADEVAGAYGMESSAKAQHDIDQLVATMTGDPGMGGYYYPRKLAPMGKVDKLGYAVMQLVTTGKLSLAGIKSTLQTVQEVLARSPSIASVPRNALTLGYELSRAWLGEGLRGLGRLAGDTTLGERIRQGGEWVSPSAERELADVGEWTHDIAQGMTKAFRGIDHPLTAKPAPVAPNASLWQRLTSPFRKETSTVRNMDATQVIDNLMDIGTLGIKPALDATFKAVGRVNNTVSARMGRRYAQEYAELAKSGDVDAANLIRMRRDNISPDLVDKMEAGTPLTPADEIALGRQVSAKLTRQTQIMLREPAERQRILNDKGGSLFWRFMSYTTANGRFIEDHVNAVRSLLNDGTISAAERWKGIGGELSRMALRVGGTQASGEIERYLARLAGREDSDLEKNSAVGRVLSNLIYASYFGPLYLLADTALYHAGIKRPHAMRGGREEKPFDVVKSMPIDAINQAINLGSAAAGAPVRAMAPDAVRPGFDEERDSATAQVGRALARVPIVKEGLSATLGPEEAKDLRTRPSVFGPKRPSVFGKRPSVFGGGKRESVFGKGKRPSVFEKKQ